MFHSIRTKLILLLLVATVVPISTSMIISYYYTTNSVTKDTIRSTESMLSLGKQNLLNYMNTVNQSSLTIYSGINQAGSLYTYIEDLEHTSGASGVPESIISPPETLRSQLLNMLRSVKEFYKIHLYTAKDHMSTLQVNDFNRHLYNPKFVLPKSSAAYVEPPHVSHNYGMGDIIPLRERQTVLTFHRPIIKTPADEILGIVSIDIKMDLIRSIGEQSGAGDTLYIFDQSGHIIYAPDEALWGTVLNEGWTGPIRESESASGHYDWTKNGFSGLVFYEKLSTRYMNWTIVKLTPYSELSASARGVTKINSYIFALFLSVAVVLMMYITIRLTRSIKKMLVYVRKVESGNLLQEIDIDSNDELGILARRFQSMMHTINDLILREYKLEIANKTNQLKALQAQTNPHFLYNALQSIATSSLQNQDQKTYSLITSLGRMMRYSMRTDEAFVALQQELDYVLAYLKLQKQRFDDTFDYTINADEKILHIPIPKMIIQPIVENYFKHGFVPREELARIAISIGWDEEMERIEITVEDNGTGIDADQLETMQMRLSRVARGEDPKDATQEHIGLENVLSRLVLLNYDTPEMHLSAVEPYGLKVLLRFPPQPTEPKTSESKEENA
ncbi:sensor histidine kinase [Gorillibacterium massiliense]|uniref:sensor histidine kinase n=1 Tax=Gorillibacterium massiliense TaxID=1280390 RepID=UPI0004B969F3|nr:histidine kinase [Gorillibacterium massiliense]